MSALLLSLLAIAAAPLLDRGARGHPRVQAFVDGLIQTVVGGILLVHVLPFGLATAGWPALFALGAGAMAAVVAHRIPGGERSAGALAVLALLLHSGVDGAALAAPDEHAEHAGEGLLAWAVVLHTVPVALATWRISRKAAGAWFAAGLLAATGLVTLGGWWATGQVLHGTSPAALGLAQCAAAGALLHVLGHVGDRHHGSAPGWGALTGVAVVGLLAWSHPIPRSHLEELGAGATFLTLLLSAAPALILGYVLIGVLHAFGPKTLGFWLVRGSRVGEAARGAMVGLPVPVCSCGALEAYTGVLARGAAPATALAFLVAGPEIGVGTVLVSLPLLGVELTAVRIVAAFAVAMVVGLIVAPSVRSSGATRPAARPEGALAAARFGLIETVDHTAPWILAGLGIAALAEPLLAADVLSGLPTGLGVVLAALVGVPAYVCASGATPLVALLLHKGLSSGAAVAFLLTGPAVNVATFVLLRRLHGGRVATLVGIVVTAAAIAIGLGVDQIPVAAAPELHRTHLPGAIEWGAAAALITLFAASLVRNGAGGFLEPLLHPHAHVDTDPPKTPHSHPHAHGHHHHGHDHGGHDHRHTPDHGA